MAIGHINSASAPNVNTATIAPIPINNPNINLQDISANTISTRYPNICSTIDKTGHIIYHSSDVKYRNNHSNSIGPDIFNALYAYGVNANINNTINAIIAI
jgi:hypothetical protein